MAALPLRREESLGLGLALAAHAAVLGWLAYQRPPAPLPLPERMEVTISDESGLTAASPDQAEAARDTAPVVSPAPPAAPPVAEPAPQAAPQPSTTPPPPRPIPMPVPIRAAPAPAPQPRPVPAKVPSPPEKAPPRPAAKPAAKPAPVAARPAPAQARPAVARPAAKPGASAFDSAFNTGIPAGKAKAAAASAPAAITGAVRSSLAGEVAREIKPKWRGRVPDGLDAEKLVTILTWNLSPDGSLFGSPRVVRQEGITSANRAQAARHAEEAIRAVRLAAPFDLPSQYYFAWKHISDFRFDKSLGQ